MSIKGGESSKLDYALRFLSRSLRLKIACVQAVPSPTLQLSFGLKNRPVFVVILQRARPVDC
jgi:hypothetical protein